MPRKWLTEADEYVCTLPPETQEVARIELRETKYARDQALEQMRSWIKKHPRIANCRLDAKFLLKFLRVKKFSVPLAQETLERYLLLRQAYAIAFSKFDHTDPIMDEIISNGMIFPVPERDHLNRRVIVGITAKFDPYKYTNADLLRVAGITYETLMEDEISQVHGYIHFGDCKGVGLHYLTLFTPKEAYRIGKNGEKTLPMRLKEGHALHIHPSLKFAVDYGFSLTPEKYRKRAFIHSSLEEVHKHIDPKLLPKEYGGVMPMKEMIAIWKKELALKRNLILSHDEMGVHMHMYSTKAREGAVSALREGFTVKKDDGMTYMTGSFRKLEVD